MIRSMAHSTIHGLIHSTIHSGLGDSALALVAGVALAGEVSEAFTALPSTQASEALAGEDLSGDVMCSSAITYSSITVAPSS